MKARVLSYRRGRHVQQTNQLLLSIKDVASRSTAAGFVGRKVVWRSKSGKEIQGKIASPHGKNGVLRARFGKGLPSEVLGKDIEILE
ncbi:MAG: 50S ribosomal protein L35ae [Candidatus Aenigmarchaeota archaeon]|nr:50S ribosomal protein L35ae [Candidatus Aenigmarchaeota archaeon]